VAAGSGASSVSAASSDSLAAGLGGASGLDGAAGASGAAITGEARSAAAAVLARFGDCATHMLHSIVAYGGSAHVHDEHILDCACRCSAHAHDEHILN
jgi:hypothetical protein